MRRSTASVVALLICTLSPVLDAQANEFIVPDQGLLSPEEDKLWYNGDFGHHFLSSSNAGRVIYYSHMFGSVLERLQDKRIEYILDAGANAGFAAVLFALAFPDAKIISLEPDLQNFRMALMNTARFPNVHVVHAGLWSKTTHIGMFASDGEWGRMFKEVPRHAPHSVPTLSVPELMDHFNFPRLDLAKIDIEGAESEVFQPDADLSWLNLADFVVMELHDFMAHYFGRQEVSSNVIAAFAHRKFSNYTDNEHVIFYRNSS